MLLLSEKKSIMLYFDMNASVLGTCSYKDTGKLPGLDWICMRGQNPQYSM